MSLEGPAPSRHVSSTPIALSAASQMLDTYLSNSELHPHLHPDALIAPTGVTFSSHGGPSGGVIMHNLRRIAAGLRGEYLEPEVTPEPEDTQEADGSSAGKMGGKKDKRKRDANGTTGDWQDKAEFELEEGVIEVGEIGDRVHVVQDGGEEPEVEVTDATREKAAKKRKGDTGAVGADADAKMSKEARKKAKMERNKQRKREDAEKKAGKA